ncbi:hypothetical protein PCE1_004948 [Barthelona sp. PCE]
MGGNTSSPARQKLKVQAIRSRLPSISSTSDIYDQPIIDDPNDTPEVTDEEFEMSVVPEEGNNDRAMLENIASEFMEQSGRRVTLGSLLFDNNFYDKDDLTREQIFEMYKTTSVVPTKPINWVKGKQLGAGSFGQVFLGLNVETGELLAVKQCPLEEEISVEIRALEKELSLLRFVDHRNIVRYLGTEISPNVMSIFLEYIAGGTLSSLIRQFGGLPNKVAKNYTRQILQGLEFLHAHRIIHRDIKGANILVTPEGCVKLADFGASVKLGTGSIDHRSLHGSPYWIAPEVVLQSGHGRKADIWSLGATVLEMLTGKPPYSNYNPMAALLRIGRGEKPEIPKDLPRYAREFLMECLQVDPDDRPTASILLQHEWLFESFTPMNLSNSSSMSVLPEPQWDSPTIDVLDAVTIVVPNSPRRPRSHSSSSNMSSYSETFSKTKSTSSLLEDHQEIEEMENIINNM